MLGKWYNLTHTETIARQNAKACILSTICYQKHTRWAFGVCCSTYQIMNSWAVGGL